MVAMVRGMRTIATRGFVNVAIVVSFALALAGCGHSSAHNGGSSFPSHSGGSSSSSSSSSFHSSGSGSGTAHGGSARSSEPSYYGTHASSGSASHGSPARTASAAPTHGASADSDGTSEMLQAVAAGLINAVADAVQDSGASDAQPSHPETPCEAQLRDFRDMHPGIGIKVPPQLRCGPNGEWGGEPVSNAGK
jgi:hypothetical protein